MSKFTNVKIIQIEYPNEIHRALAVRRKVFIEEQGYSEKIEKDGLDGACQHWIATCDKENEDGTIEHNVDIGNVRLIPKSEGVAKLGRLAVLSSARGLQVGRLLVEAFANYCKHNNYTTIVLHSQYPRRGFYEKTGFRIEEGDDQIFDEAGTPHVRMWMRL
ncbi:acyl-CoA N-acyltransferase [Parasitella parasitica]|nr:acyl-CoA N-acyltransferase [Parasitella parasitica]